MSTQPKSASDAGRSVYSVSELTQAIKLHLAPAEILLPSNAKQAEVTIG